MSVLNVYEWEGNNPVPPELWWATPDLRIPPFFKHLQVVARLDSNTPLALVDTHTQCVYPHELSVSRPVQGRRNPLDSLIARGKFLAPRSCYLALTFSHPGAIHYAVQTH